MGVVCSHLGVLPVKSQYLGRQAFVLDFEVLGSIYPISVVYSLYDTGFFSPTVGVAHVSHCLAI